MFTLAEIIDLAVRIEKNGEKAYRKARDAVSDPSLAAMLQRLAEEESDHEKWFTALKGKVEPRAEDPRLEEMGNTLLQGILGDQTFSIDDADFSRIKDLEGLLELSMEFEKDTILFYEMLSAFIQDEKSLERLDLIIEEENRHVRLLEDCLERKGT